MSPRASDNVIEPVGANGSAIDFLDWVATAEIHGSSLDSQDYAAIQSVAALYGHVIDSRRWDLLQLVYVSEGIYDGSQTGSARHSGLAAIVHYLSTSLQPSAHHATNVLLTSEVDGQVRGVSKYFVVRRDMSIASGFYRDLWRRTSSGWRLEVRSSHQLSTAAKQVV